jgi:hypothetical protein
MSRFNTQTICEACEAKERAHPKYPEARAAEEADVKRTLALGLPNYFPGIGLPEDLKAPAQEPMTKSELLHIREVLLELSRKYPKVLYDGILNGMDATNETHEAIVAKLETLTSWP